MLLPHYGVALFSYLSLYLFPSNDAINIMKQKVREWQSLWLSMLDEQAYAVAPTMAKLDEENEEENNKLKQKKSVSCIYISFSMFHKYLKWNATCKIPSFCKCHVIPQKQNKTQTFIQYRVHLAGKKTYSCSIGSTIWPFTVLLLCLWGHQPEPNSHLNTPMTVKCGALLSRFFFVLDELTLSKKFSEWFLFIQLNNNFWLCTLFPHILLLIWQKKGTESKTGSASGQMRQYFDRRKTEKDWRHSLEWVVSKQKEKQYENYKFQCDLTKVGVFTWLGIQQRPLTLKQHTAKSYKIVLTTYFAANKQAVNLNEFGEICWKSKRWSSS